MNHRWSVAALGQVCEKIGSGATPQGGSNAYLASGISLIRSQNVLDFQFSGKGLAFIDDAQAAKLRNVEVQEHDVLLNITGDSVARCCMVASEVLPARVNQHVAIVRPSADKADPHFLLYTLLALKEELLSQSEIGGTRRALTKGMLEDLEILLPPLPEQKAIAAVLSSLDDKIDLLHRQNKTLEALAETLFRQWFVEEADEGLEEGKLGDVVEINPSRALAKGQVAPYLEMSNVNESVFHPKDWIDRNYGSGMKFRNGDTLLARITPCLENGKTCYVTFLGEDEIGWGSTEFVVLRMREPYHPFISYLLAKNSDFREFAIGCMTGTSGRQRVQGSVLAEFELRIPQGAVVESLNAICDSMVRKLIGNAKQIRTLARLRDSLLPKLMSGEVRVAL